MPSLPAIKKKSLEVTYKDPYPKSVPAMLLAKLIGKNPVAANKKPSGIKKTVAYREINIVSMSVLMVIINAEKKKK